METLSRQMNVEIEIGKAKGFGKNNNYTYFNIVLLYLTSYERIFVTSLSLHTCINFVALIFIIHKLLFYNIIRQNSTKTSVTVTNTTAKIVSNSTRLT